MPNAKMASPGMRERAYAWATAIGLQDVSPLSSGSFYRWRRNLYRRVGNGKDSREVGKKGFGKAIENPVEEGFNEVGMGLK